MDIDETMVCAYREANIPPELRGEHAQRAAGAFQLFGKVELVVWKAHRML